MIMHSSILGSPVVLRKVDSSVTPFSWFPFFFYSLHKNDQSLKLFYFGSCVCVIYLGHSCQDGNTLGLGQGADGDIGMESLHGKFINLLSFLVINIRNRHPSALLMCSGAVDVVRCGPVR